MFEFNTPCIARVYIEAERSTNIAVSLLVFLGLFLSLPDQSSCLLCRRTFKDTITFIPVVIILLIPLSPIGHVIVFGAIQRVFPDFFPSCFTERRQNLLELYESTEYSAVVINETWQQKLIRISQALRVLVIKSLTKLYTSLGGEEPLKESEDNDSDVKS